MKKTFIILAGACLLHTAQAQNIDRSKKPAAGPAPVISIKDPATFKLANGITVMVVENHKLPKVSATYSIDAGPITEGKKAGVTDLMGQMLNEGTKRKSKAEFDEAVDKIGADVSLSASGGNVSALSRYFNEAFMLMAEALKEPAFKQESFDKLKSQALTGLKSSERSAKAISGRVTKALTYGVNHPAGEFETEETINGITLDDIKKFYSKYITPSRGYLIFVGDITPAQAKALTDKAFATWKGSPLQLEKLPVVSNPAKTQINIIDVPNAVQTEITVTNLVNIPMSSPDYFPVLLANQILGGGAESRLFMNLREKHGFTYGAYSNIGTGRFQSTFSASASVRNEKADSAINEFLYEINKMRSELVSDDELKDAKALYNGTFALQMENPARLATFASNIIINNLPKDFYRTYLQKINAVTKQDIQRVAQKYFNYNNTRVVAVGKAAVIQPNIAKLGHEVLAFDKWAKPVAAATASNKETASQSASTNADVTTIISDYLKAIGGVEEAKKVTAMAISGELEMQGMKLQIEEKKMAPNKNMQSVSMGGNVMQKSVFNGTTGYEMQMGQKKDMDQEDIDEKKVYTSLFEQVDYLSNKAFKLTLKGTEKVNGADAYKVEVTLPNGKIQTEFYDVKSKLLVKVDSDEEVGNGMTMNKSMEYGDYRKIGNILFPYKNTLTMSAGPQQQVLEMKILTVKLNEGVTEADFQ